ncbi:MAG: class I SAM-dependent methyltransferase [Hymenobacteraceae bacterium]|nr:class I SAM-dependent methyltransferase [Hymenobacteraceae bacterium]
MDTNAILPKEISTKKMSDFVQRILDDLSASERIKMTYLGVQLGLYKAMAFTGSITVGELARRTRAKVRLVKKWLQHQAAEGFVSHEPDSDTYALPIEHAIALTDQKSPYYIGGHFQSNAVEKTKRFFSEPLMENKNSRSNAPVEENLAEPSARFFSTEYVSSLFESWLPGVDGLTEKLEQGITVADLGCGRHGASTLIMAEAYPKSHFLGFDRYESSVERAGLLAREKQINNVEFELATAEMVYAHKYDLITLIECLHHMGGSVQDLLIECYEVLKPDGVLVAVEAKDRYKVGEELYQRMRSSKGQHLVAEEVSRVELGVDTNEKELQQAARKAGFASFHKVAETVYDKVYELRP